MTKYVLISLAMIGASTAANVSIATACPGGDSETTASAVQQIDIQQLSAMLKKGDVSVLDANNDSTRTKYGVIPGAVLLTNFASYALDQLPTDKQRPLVFYCANPHCRASDAAAHRALEAGYARVAVLPDGIMGWKAAGMPTSTLPRS